jgi:phage-related protein
MEVRILENVEAFIAALDTRDRGASMDLLDLLESYGHAIRPPYSKRIRGPIFELRAHGDTDIRLLYAYRRGYALVLVAFRKKSQTLPERHLRNAERRLGAFDAI